MPDYGIIDERPVAEEEVVLLTPAEQDRLQSDRPGYGTRHRLEVGFNLVNATCGAGMIGLPFAVRLAGFYPGLLLSIFVAILSQLGSYMLILAGQRIGIYKYAVLVEYLMGRPGYHFLNWMIFLQSGGTCIGYFILIGDTLPVLLAMYFPQYAIHRSIVIWMIAVLCILPLNLARSIGSLARWSIVSVLCFPVILLTLLIRAPAYASEHTAPIGWQPTNLVGAIGIMAFAFACSQVAFNNYLTLRDQSLRGWTIASSFATCMSWSLSMLFAILGYLSFGTDLQPNLFLNFAADDAIVNFGRLTLSVTMILTIPMAFYPTREAVQKSLGLESATRQPSQTEHYVLTVILFFGITAIGAYARSLAKVYSIIGGFSASTLVYILPAVAYFATRQRGQRQLPSDRSKEEEEEEEEEEEDVLKALLARVHHTSSSRPATPTTPYLSSSRPVNDRPSHLLDLAATILLLWGTVLVVYTASFLTAV
ncbi:hypothetical protein EC973_001501 [Apophysomyces ossiformis]|uniref:Amino acid transporter transmembrane domain-containing protein n=1 Tax=Apophysomyces ossiformis TaxID=679940 RepID=A0A8H7EMB6_9FUNG|nr:hypothetical protein EC973_001501 [Apophysomyces ossiformis]